MHGGHVDGIPWVPGAGCEEIEPFLREVPPEGLLFSTGCRMEQEGRDPPERVARLGKASERTCRLLSRASAGLTVLRLLGFV
jgi:hypothetical protein